MSGVLSLFELNRLIRSVVNSAFPDTFMVTAEIASCDVKNHCYMTLIDKDDDVVRAEMRAVIWANRYRVISGIFKEATGVQLSKGIKILFEAEVNFHERYGLKINILNVDPSYTVGELAVRRKEILDRLEREQLIDKNKMLDFPLVPQRIGIVSSATAAGYEDLLNHLVNNPYGYRFTCTLYQAIMQGDRAEDSILRALRHCSENARNLDVVVLVRGGGGQMDLHCFDSYEIGKAISLLPVPVISGIGHQRDITVVDEVSNRRAKTPTAVADMIITSVKEFEERINMMAHNLVHGIHRLNADMRENLSSLCRELNIAASNVLLNKFHMLQTFIKGIKYSLKLLHNEKQRIRAKESNINHLNPKNVLKRGYSITYNNGKAVKSVNDVKMGDSLKTILHEGEVMSNVQGKSRRGKKRE